MKGIRGIAVALIAILLVTGCATPATPAPQIQPARPAESRATELAATETLTPTETSTRLVTWTFTPKLIPIQAHLFDSVPAQPRRCVHAPAHPRPHHARHGPPLSCHCPDRYRVSPSSRIARRKLATLTHDAIRHQRRADLDHQCVQRAHVGARVQPVGAGAICRQCPTASVGHLWRHAITAEPTNHFQADA